MRLLALFFLICLIVTISIEAQNTSDDTLADPDWRVRTGPSDAVAFSPDGLWVAVGGRDNLIRLYRVRDGELRAMLSGHTSWVTQIAFSPNGERIVSAGRDNTVRVWDLASYRQLFTFYHHTATVTGVAYSDNGLMIASGSLDGTVWIADAATGEELATLTNYSGPVWSVAFSPDGRSLVSGSEDGTLWLWGLYDSTLSTFEGDGIAVTGLQFNPEDAAQLVAGNWDGSVWLWDVATGERIRRYGGHAGPVTGVAFNADGTEIISAGLDGTLRIWDTASGWLKATLRGDGFPLSAVDFTAPGSAIVSAGLDGGLEFWDRQGRVETFIASRSEPPVTPTAAIVQVPPTSPPPPPAPQPTLPPDVAIPTGVPIQPIATAIPPPTTAPEVVQAPSPTSGNSLSLPTVNIYSTLTSFPIEGGTWAIDPWESRVGHFQGTAWVNHTGNIVLGAHSEYPDGTRGLFNGLYGVNVGDPIYLTINGEQRRYIVTERYSVDYRNLDPVRPTGDNRLTLITCDVPSFDANASIYWERYVVVALLDV